ncbi:hypothetical protein BCD96_004565 [Clostridium beijerinckii]|nr:hypothetical protein [Clostridium beijerinckii]NRU37049.1 hypothetical protein [Clostridium beijerinckii]NSA99672.1 hypothetical protein [Clostridium beijerinckii]OOM58683.1 hypothetical protein CLOBI_38640 [Clostridium beijerinckii]OOM65059.1 hypothetical protein CLBEIC_53340 [Clostridium beijerinckii]
MYEVKASFSLNILYSAELAFYYYVYFERDIFKSKY